MSTFERYLTIWVALCIIVGIALGHGCTVGVLSPSYSTRTGPLGLPLGHKALLAKSPRDFNELRVRLAEREEPETNIV